VGVLLIRFVVSTALWTGVYLADVLEFVKPIRGKAKHVIFEGVDALPNGPYGTSQRLSWATNRERGMLIGARQIICIISGLHTLTAHSVGDEWTPS
jgi:DMSO/TMAO reductase YedYZ molybdopterin-dependent catalytic subunit